MKGRRKIISDLIIYEIEMLIQIFLCVQLYLYFFKNFITTFNINTIVVCHYINLFFLQCSTVLLDIYMFKILQNSSCRTNNAKIILGGILTFSQLINNVGIFLY